MPTCKEKLLNRETLHVAKHAYGWPIHIFHIYLVQMALTKLKFIDNHQRKRENQTETIHLILMGVTRWLGRWDRERKIKKIFFNYLMLPNFFTFF